MWWIELFSPSTLILANWFSTVLIINWFPKLLVAKDFRKHPSLVLSCPEVQNMFKICRKPVMFMYMWFTWATMFLWQQGQDRSLGLLIHISQSVYVSESEICRSIDRPYCMWVRESKSNPVYVSLKACKLSQMHFLKAGWMDHQCGCCWGFSDEHQLAWLIITYFWEIKAPQIYESKKTGLNEVLRLWLVFWKSCTLNR